MIEFRLHVNKFRLRKKEICEGEFIFCEGELDVSYT